jgi:uncharacterized membrane protein (UPF0127 family)
MRLVQAGNGSLIASEVLIAHTFFRRLKGLLFTESLPAGHCLHIQPCRSVHTFLMKYSIDILYLDADHCIVGVDANLKPGKRGSIHQTAVSVVELNQGSIEESKLQIGQAVRFEPTFEGERLTW